MDGGACGRGRDGEKKKQKMNGEKRMWSRSNCVGRRQLRFGRPCPMSQFAEEGKELLGALLLKEGRDGKARPCGFFVAADCIFFRV